MSTPPLSPAAQAVLDATRFEVNAECYAPWIAAAAIRALVEQVAGIAPAGGREWSEGQAAACAAITTAVRHMQSIAAELDGGAPQPTSTETPNNDH
jgi:hypothetical protein